MVVRDTAPTRAWVRDLVRSGLLAPDELYAEVREAIAVDHPELPPEATARHWIEAAETAWRHDAEAWQDPTDFELLQRAFGDLSRAGIPVLQGCTDHWAARDALRRAAEEWRGIAWFTPPDVWHAIDEAMLEVNLWHPNTANAAPGDALLEEVLAVFARHGLPAVFDEGRVEVGARWQRRPGE